MGWGGGFLLNIFIILEYMVMVRGGFLERLYVLRFDYVFFFIE